MLHYFDAACVWPFPNCDSSLDDRVADFFMALNRGTLDFLQKQTKNKFPVITFSHFVPHVKALFPGFVSFRHVMGCRDLDKQIDAIKPHVHCFGHSHVNVDELIRGTRYVQNALGHPADHADASQHFAPLLLWRTPSHHQVEETTSLSSEEAQGTTSS